ncbi:MAG: flavin monoamine oxidase family protein [Sphingomonadaceae bacterium]|nr:flavin monoamine oxidase family protein [Sphingomonadaceae bacterium]
MRGNPCCSTTKCLGIEIAASLLGIQSSYASLHILTSNAVQSYDAPYKCTTSRVTGRCGVDLDRRQAISTGIFATLAGSTATYAARNGGASRKVDVAIVGAGFAGLTAATTLTRAGQDVAVVEQLGRVGGRTKAAILAGHPVDIGGQWVGPTQTALLELGRRYGVPTELQYASGNNLFVHAGNLRKFEGDVPPLADAEMAQLAAAMEKIETQAASLNPYAPWASVNGEQLDAVSSRQWFEANVPSPAARATLELFWRVVYSVEASEISHLYALEYVRASGGLAQLTGTRGGAQDATFKGGLHLIARKMAAELGDRLTSNVKVIRIIQSDNDIRVIHRGGEITARRLVLAIPPSALARIDISPPLPANARYIADRMPLGSVVKFLVAYKSPFWRERGLSGQIIDTDSPVKVIFDKSMDDGLGALVGFFNGSDAGRASILSQSERRNLVIEQAKKYFGPEAANPIDYIDNDWLAEDGIGGGYTSIPGPGVFSRAGGALRQPFGRIHFAGTETSDVWPGYVEGAVRSGQRVAAEIVRSKR